MQIQATSMHCLHQSDAQGCQLLRFGRSFIRFPSLTTPKNTPSKNYAEQKFRSDSSIFVKFRFEVTSSRSLGEPAEPRFSEIARDFARLSKRHCSRDIFLGSLMPIFTKSKLISCIKLHF